MKTSLNYFIISISFTFLFFCYSCKKENIPETVKVDYISNQSIRYTILVVPAGNTGFKSVPQGLDSAFVSLVMNDSIYTVATDENGIAKFNNLAAGIAAVTIRYANHCTANLIVDLSAKSDTIEDNNNIRNVSTMVALFPFSGNGTASVSGRAFADLDITLPGNEIVPANMQISSIIEPTQFINYVKHKGDGQILSIAYEHTINHATTDLNGDYTFSVPASGSGLKIIITANDFVYDQQISAGVYQRKIFRPVADTIMAYSDFDYIIDIIFN